MSTSYSPPPLYPTLNLSSGWAPTLLSCAVATNPGIPSEVVKNWVPRFNGGMGGLNAGYWPKVQPNLFPFNASADSLYANDYVWRFSGSARSANLPYALSLPSGANKLGTIFAVFTVEDIYGADGGGSGFTYAPLCRMAPSTITGTNQQPIGFSTLNTGNGGAIPGIYWAASGGETAPYMAMISNSSFQWLTSCPIIPGHSYAAAWATSDQNSTLETVSLFHAMRFYLYDLTTATLISATGASDQVFSGAFGNETNQTYSNFTFGWGTALDLQIYPGPFVGGTDAPIQVKLIGADNYFWDDSGRWTAIPAGFSGVDPFTAFVANIYGMLGSTYTTGVSAPALINGATGQGTSTWPYLTTSATGPAGNEAGTTLVALGDIAVTYVDNVTIGVTVTWPRGGPIAPSGSWVWKLYASTNSATGATGVPVITYTGEMPNFQWTGATSGQAYFLNVTAFDGTNTYAYAQTPASLNPLPDLIIVAAGNSIFSVEGKDPMHFVGVMLSALGCNCTVIQLSVTGSTSQYWDPTAATASTMPGWFPATPYSPFTLLQKRIAAELLFRPNGTKVDTFWELIGNDTPLTTGIVHYTNISTALLASGNVGRVIFVASPWQMQGHNLPQNTNAVSGALALQNALANGTTIFSIGDQLAYTSLNLIVDQGGNHPDYFMALLEASRIFAEYTQILYPAAPPVAGTYFVDPDAGSLIVTADDAGTFEVDPDAGSLIIV